MNPLSRFLVTACLLTATALAAATTLAESEAVRRGERLYQIYCANCHGPQAHGDGPVAKVLTVPPTDLTRLAATHDGDFPSEEARRVIDGRVDVTGHGRRDMPVWGLTFQVQGRTADQESEVRGRIDDLVAFLKTLQKTPQE